MKKQMSSRFTPVELEFMQVLWEGDNLSTEDIQNALIDKERSLSDGSIRKILSILMRKGYVVRIKKGRGYLYSSVIEKEKAKDSMLKDLLRRMFGDSVPGMVATLLTSKNISEKELQQIKEMIKDYEKEEE